MIKNTYDSLGRITGIAHSHNDKTLADYHYKWDAANRITEINDDKYGYDKTNQLLSAVYAKKPKEQYAYDLNGNRLTALLQGQEKKYETGNFNRLLSENGEKLEYDAEGNRIAKGDIKYEWDHRNRLVKVETPQETIEYTYDYQNRLVKRSAGKNITHFIHDGWQIVRQYENGKPIKRFLWGTKQDELICENDNWTLGDHLNTIREVVNSDGKVIAHCDYNAFGKCLSPLKDLSFAYTGKMTDSATGLQWNINRWYDANAGRWISEDPIGFGGKDSNLYRYTYNSTIILVDVFGLAYYQLKQIYGKTFEWKEISHNGKPDLVVYTLALPSSLSITAKSDWIGWWWTYNALAEKTITMDCNHTDGTMTYHGCELGANEKKTYVAARVDTLCKYDTLTKTLTIIAGGAASYFSGGSSVGITITVLGTGGGFSYSSVGATNEIGESWDYQYQCKCSSQ